jgi:hypothetical protein
MKEASSDAKNAIELAISSGSPTRPIEFDFPKVSINWS